MVYKGSRLDFQLIDHSVDQYMHNDDLAESLSANPSLAFIGLFLNKRFDLDSAVIDDSIVDGTNDCGIDAIYIDEDSGNRPIVNIIQSKYYRSEEKYNRALEAGALDKMHMAIDELILGNPKKEKYKNINEDLKNKLEDIRGLEKETPRYHIIFISNSFPPNVKSKEHFEAFLESYNHDQQYFDTEYDQLVEIAELLAPKQEKIIDANLHLIGKYMDFSNGMTNVLVGRIEGTELAKLREQAGVALFDKNVRGYLTQKNDVNKDIIQSATGEDAYQFFVLNNGITIVCSDMEYIPKKESIEVNVSNLQIVNGGQTTNSLYEAYKEGKLSDEVDVLIRIIKTSDDNLLGKITKATNSQTTVCARDLHSNDSIQKKIEADLKTKGYFYEARTNKYNDEPWNKRIDAVKAAQSYYAYALQKPADAKNKKRFLFGTLYPEVFNDSLNTDTFLNAYLIWRQVHTLSRSLKEEYSFASYAEYHIVALLGQMDILDPSDRDLIEKKTRLILEATDTVVQERIKEEGDSYSHRAFFINPSTIGKLTTAVEQLELQEKQS
ncbi:AIPR family protein [Bifidobacterium sp. ESL0784]|uniref:AIPR family protein n=1 Tax=Bifidobacterium sp. ESL0784 TaxID=2983231 RepID=UPI0023FA2CF0|nr:AIPR family protein [Bifidobacterium sp. ESL0784]MDF7640550.1 AIPR family protein [Bifidobacterium sp. ESL0784]